MTRLARYTLVCLAALAAFASMPRPAAAANLDLAPDAVLGKPDPFVGPGGAVSASNLLGPSATAEDPRTGELWVADALAHRALRYASARAFANGALPNLVLGQAGFDTGAANRGGAAGAATMHTPMGIAVDQAGGLYVADTENHRVLFFRPPFANGMAASAVYGQAGFTDSAPNRGRTAPGVDTANRPMGLALDAQGFLWIADEGNGRVIRLQSGPVPLPADANWAAQVQVGVSSAQPGLRTMNRPAGVALDGRGDLWVADPGFHRITRYPRESFGTGAEKSATLVLCQPDFVTAVRQAGERGCDSPGGVAIDSAGRVHVADTGNSRLLRFDTPANGAPYSALAGQDLAEDNFCNRGTSQVTPATLCFPRHAGFDRHGDLLVADSAAARVLRFDLPAPRGAPVVTTTGPANLVRGLGGLQLTVNGSGFHDDSVVRVGGTPRPTRYISPHRLVATLTAADAAAAGPVPVQVSTPGPGGGDSAVHPVPVTERSSRDATADRSLGRASTQSLDPASLGGETVGGVNASMLRPGNGFVAIDRVTGRLFASDFGHNRVLSWPDAASLQGGQPADVILGQPDATSGGSVAPSATSLNRPAGLAVDPLGRLFVADRENHRVLRFDPPFSTGMAASRVFGQAGAFDRRTSGAPTARSMSSPGSLAAVVGRLVVGDAGNNRVLVFENPDADDVADVVIGQPDFASNAEPATGPASLRYRGGGGEIALDGEGRLLVADGGNHRVLRYSPPFANGMAASLVLGQTDFVSNNPGSGPTQLWSPAALRRDSEGNVLVGDPGNRRIVRFEAPLATGMAASAAFGGNLAGEAAWEAYSLALDAGGNLYVNSRGILAFDRPFPIETSRRLVNLSTRLRVQAGEDVLIGGFIIDGTTPKKVVVRARGPSLAGAGIANPLDNPVLQLFSGATPIAANDNWRQTANAAELEASGFAPADERESAVLATLQPGAYTAIVSGAGGGTGVGIVEVFELDGPASPLANIATRGRVQTGDDVMIAGFIIHGTAPQTVVVRARGPSLAAAGVASPLSNPMLQLYAGNQIVIDNDDWAAHASARAVRESGFAPADARESAFLVTLQPGAYTAVVSGVGGTTGVAIVEVFVP